MPSHHNHNFYCNHDHEGKMVVMVIMMTIMLMMLPYKVILTLTQQRKRVHDPFHPKSRAMTRSHKKNYSEYQTLLQLYYYWLGWSTPC